MVSVAAIPGAFPESSPGKNSSCRPHTSKQDRPNSQDVVTDAYTLINFDIRLQQRLFGRATRIDFGVRNAANTSYRDFLSRYKEFALDPGRNIILRISTDR